MRKFHLLIILLVFVFCSAKAQDKSNRGTEFWLGYGNNVLFNADFPVNSQTLALYLSSEEAATVTISVNGTLWSKTVDIPANSVDVSVTIPKDGPEDCRIQTEGLYDRAIHIVSTQPIVVYAHQYSTQLSGATLLLPVDTYGYSYYSINYRQPAVGGTPVKNWFFVIASEDNTTVEITPAGETENGKLPGETFTVTLNKGQLYNVFGQLDAAGVTSDLTGSRIVSVAGADGNCHPIAVFSGCSRFLTCDKDGGEIAQQQIFPASAWGTRYLSYHSFYVPTNPFATPFINFYRVMVADPVTVVKKNGVVLTGLINNSFYEYQSDGGDYIEADKPIMVCQYTPNSNACTGSALSPQGDPELLFLTPIEQGIKQARVFNTKNANITVNYLTIIIPNNGISSLLIDGAPVAASQYIIHPNNSNYTVVAKRLLGAAAQHTITSDSAFSAMIYGAGTFESYGYIAGTLINNLNSKSSIKNVYNSNGKPDEFTCPRTPFTVNISIAYKASLLQWHLSEVPGLTPAKDTLITNPLPFDSGLIGGRKYFRYDLSIPLQFSDTGTYRIPFSFTSPEIDHCSHTEKSFAIIHVKLGPTGGFTCSYKGCSGDTALFTGLPDVNGYAIKNYTWQFDDGSKDTAIFVKKIFPEGNHAVAMRVTADNGCVGDSTQTITTFSKPVAGFGFEKNVCAGDSVRFIDSSEVAGGSLTSWFWTFDDGTKTTRNSGAPFYHNYAIVKSYSPSLYVVSAQGCGSDTITKTVSVNNKPSATISYTGKTCEDSTLVFSPAVNANGNTITGGTWLFGNGDMQQVAGSNSVSYVYKNAQNSITVKYVVLAGCESDTATLTIAAIHPAPQANFTATAASYCPQSDIQFNYTGTGNIAAWSWQFGDGSSATQAPSPLTHSYVAGGNYSVSLKVVSANGCGSEPFILPVTIYENPAVNAGPSILKVAGETATLKAFVGNAGSFTYTWSPASFLSSANILNPVTSTPDDIIYKITATGDAGNCTATDTVSVKVLRDIYVPTAFSPNNDGLNDVWNIPGVNNHAGSSVTVFNRWGQIIFQSKGYARPWDGTAGGKQQPVGAYPYIVIPDEKKPLKLTGFVMIVR
jgi:gliding motility-associated-like protein